jgi:hypothetical protein
VSTHSIRFSSRLSHSMPEDYFSLTSLQSFFKGHLMIVTYPELQPNLKSLIHIPVQSLYTHTSCLTQDPLL